MFIRRNNLYQHSEIYRGKDCCHVAIQWDSDSIACGVIPMTNASDSMNQHMKGVRTPFTVPPLELVHLLRTEHLLVNSAFRTPDAFFATVIDSLYLCEADIRRHGGEQFIWTKDGNPNKKPLNEPEISRYVAGFLSSHGAARNFDVTCESIAGTGNLDFHVVAPIQEQGMVKIAIEAKKANHQDIEHGLKTQLPEYMARIGTKYGIFLIYWLRSTKYLFPASQESYPQFEIEVLHPIPRLPTVRCIGLDLSYGATPSKK